MKKVNLKNFLYSEEKTIKTTKGSSYNVVLVKVPSEYAGIEYIYCQNLYREEVMNPFDFNKHSWDFVGISDLTSGIFYSNRIDDCVIDTEDTILMSMRELRDSIVNKVNDDIRSIIDYNLDNIPVSKEDALKYETYYTEKEIIDTAKRNILYDKQQDKGSYAGFNFNHEQDFTILLEYLIDSENTMKNLANKYISKNTEKIYKNIKYNQLLEAKTRELKANGDMELGTKIYNILKEDDTRKTVNIVYKRDDKEEVKFKVDATRCRISTKGNSIYSHCILGGANEKVYKNIYGWEEIYLDGIQQISYGKKVLYSKAN